MRTMVRSLASRVRKTLGIVRFDREAVARHYLRGDGIEIGALHQPLRLPPAARVTYVDRLTVPDLLRQYPTLDPASLVPVDVVDDGERLATVADRSQDFVIANHFLEHCEDPIAALGNFLRVLRKDGMVYLAVPDKRYTFDRDRPVTPLAHLFRDHVEGPARSRRQHFEEWARLVNGAREPAEVERQVEELLAMNYSIHFHVWTQADFLELLLAVRPRLGFEVELFLKHGPEIVTVLRKDAAA